jgi:hypothetical protein
LPGVSTGHHYPGHLFERRRHHVVGAGRPNLTQALLKQWKGSWSVAAVSLYLPGEQQGLGDPDAYPNKPGELPKGLSSRSETVISTANP